MSNSGKRITTIESDLREKRDKLILRLADEQERYETRIAPIQKDLATIDAMLKHIDSRKTEDDGKEVNHDA